MSRLGAKTSLRATQISAAGLHCGYIKIPFLYGQTGQAAGILIPQLHKAPTLYAINETDKP